MAERNTEKTGMDREQKSAVIWFTDEACQDVGLTGGKGASLARMTAEGLPVPPGFVIPSYVLERSLDAERMLELAAAQSAEGLQELVARCQPPTDEITSAYENLAGARVTATYKRVGDAKVAVRSSAVAEDSEAASYAGQQETYLFVEGGEEVCRRVVDCWASFFSERALFYRSQKGSRSLRASSYPPTFFRIPSTRSACWNSRLPALPENSRNSSRPSNRPK